MRDTHDNTDEMFQSPLRRVHSARNIREDPRILSLHCAAVVVDRHPLQNGICLHQTAQPIDAGVQVVLDLVKVAVVAVGDLGRDVTLRDSIHILGGHVEWADHGVQRLVDASDNLPVAALELLDVPAAREFAFHRRLGERFRLGDQLAQGFHDLDERLAKQILLGLHLYLNSQVSGRNLLRQASTVLDHLGQAAKSPAQCSQFILAVQIDAHVDVAERQFLGGGLHRPDGIADDTSQQQSQANGQQDAHRHKNQDHVPCGCGGGFIGLFAPFGHSDVDVNQ